MTATSTCGFCDVEAFQEAMIYLDNDFCFYASSRFGDTVAILPGAGIIVPKAHRATAFDLTAAEWTATFELLVRAREVIDQQLAPDGYLIGWNCGPAAGQTVDHAHLHVIPRFADEPYAGRGLRWLVRQPENVRPEPFRQGNGLAAVTPRHTPQTIASD